MIDIVMTMGEQIARAKTRTCSKRDSLHSYISHVFPCGKPPVGMDVADEDRLAVDWTLDLGGKIV